MAHKFVRNITGIRSMPKQALNTNEQNDLLSDDKHAFIRNGKHYYCLTDNVKAIRINDTTLRPNNPYPDIVQLPKLVAKINGQEPNAQGEITIASGGGGGDTTSIGIAENIMTSNIWKVRLSKGVDLADGDVQVEQILFDGIKKTVPQGNGLNIHVDKTNHFTTIEMTLSPDIYSICGRYEMTLQVPSFSEGVILVVNPDYNDVSCTTYIHGVSKRQSDTAETLFFGGAGLMEVFANGEAYVKVNDTQQVPAQASDDFIALGNTQAGVNYLTIEQNAKVFYATTFFKP